MSLGTILMLFYYLESLLWGPLAALSNEMQTLQTAEVSIVRVRELLQASSRLHDGTARLPGGALAVELRDVRFAYPGASQGDAFGTFTQVPAATSHESSVQGLPSSQRASSVLVHSRTMQAGPCSSHRSPCTHGSPS